MPDKIMPNPTFTFERLAERDTATILASSSGSVSITVGANELWEVTGVYVYGTNITVDNIYIVVNAVKYYVSSGNFQGASIWLDGRNQDQIGANVTNTDTIDQTAYIVVVGRKWRVD